MPESKAKEVAKLFGLELEEEFAIKGSLHKYKFTEDGLMCWPIFRDDWISSASLNNLIAGKLTIIKLPKQILTDKEKEYLSAVIKPFRDKVSTISKRSSDDNGEYIAIVIEEKPHDNTMFFPYFEGDTMYQGMEIGKFYTLEELGL